MTAQQMPNHFEIITQEDVDAYFTVVEEAYQIHLDREKIRKGLWKQYPAEAQARNIVTKSDRIMRSLEYINALETVDLEAMTPAQILSHEALKTNVLEELHDIINYAIFTARKLTGE